MDMLATSRVLGVLIKRHFSSASKGDRDCRLLVPGLTRKIAQQVHGYLRQKGINSYLVVGENEKPNERERWIRAVGLTSHRIGSFVAIASPGQLVHIQDSIRGSGGAIRSLAFSEEWPWKDDGNEPFRFGGPVLDALFDHWSIKKTDAVRDWLRTLTLSGLLKHTRSSSRRTHLLLEDILGTFDPTLPGLPDVKKRFLYHAGIPCPPETNGNVLTLIQNSVRLCKRISERCQKDEDVRKQSRAAVRDVVPEDECTEVTESLDRFLDGVGRSKNHVPGLLVFHGCWGQDRNDPTDWDRLHADCLAKFFDVRDEEAELSYSVGCERGLVFGDGKQLATFVGEQVQLDVKYRIPANQFSSKKWMVRVLNRQRTVVEKKLFDNEAKISLSFDTATSMANYSRKIPLRIALVLDKDNQDNLDKDNQDNDVREYKRLGVHLCGQDRHTFAVVKPGFEVIDAIESDESDEEETPDKKVSVDDPVHVFLFSHGNDNVAMRADDSENLEVIEIGMPGIWRSAKWLDAGAEPSGQVTVRCKVGSRSVVICLEASDLEKGEFTIEDELRVLLSGAREKRLEDVVCLFNGENRDPYPALGGIDEAARRRIALAEIVTTKTGWRPLLTDLLGRGNHVPGALGKFFNHLGTVDGGAFATLFLPADAASLLEAYSDARKAVLQEVKEGLEMEKISVEHPVYASHPIFMQARSPEMEILIVNYLEAYRKILAYVSTAIKDLEWSQLLVLTHLDCVVHWDDTPLRNAFLLVGPWHPLVLAKRFMVQAALLSRAHRLPHEKNRKKLRHLSVLLGQVQGFRWVVGLSAEDRQVEPAFVTTTSDPGWHLAIKTPRLAVAPQEDVGGLLGMLRTSLRINLGLQVEMGTGVTHNLPVTALSSYMRAFPSRRSIGVYIRRGYAGDKVVRNIDAHLHGKEGPTSEGEKLPGGARLYLEDTLDKPVDAQWSDPPLYIYGIEDEEKLIQKEHPDIYMLPPVGEVSFKPATANHDVPRGVNLEAVFSEPLRQLTEGQTLVPKSITYEFDTPRESAIGVGGAFVEALGQIRKILGVPMTTVSSVDLPQRLAAPWVVIPGQSIDPAILVKYVRDGADRNLQERALWDYKLDLAVQANSFCILSTIPRGFEAAVNGFFGQEIAGEFVIELGKIGLAIGGEALKSGRHALGIIGLVGAVRMLVGEAIGGHASPLRGQGVTGFLVSVDSFASFFGKNNSADEKRADLLAVSLVLPSHGSGKLRISAFGVESKFVSGTLGGKRPHAALEQGLATARDFEELVRASLRKGGMPERLALLELLRFGLRITSPSKPAEIEQWVNTERSIYQAILAADYEYIKARYDALLVSTEGGLPGVAEHSILQKGVWVRLTRGHWPGVANTSQIRSIKLALSTLFHIPGAPLPRPVSMSSPSPVPRGGEVNEPPKVSHYSSESDSPTAMVAAPAEEAQPIVPSASQDDGIPLEEIFIGVDASRRKVHFAPQSPSDHLDNMNVMVTGSSGTGKTQLLKYLICKLREQGKNVLILDLKNDFASDGTFCKRAHLKRVFVGFDGLPYNPLIPYPLRHPVTGKLLIQCGQHIAGISSVLKQTYRLGAQQQAAVKNAIVAAFTSAGIPTTGSKPHKDGLSFPDFSNVGDSLQDDNLLAYNRLDPLFTLDLFREDYRGQSFHALVNRAAVLDLSQIRSDDIKNALAQLVVLSAHAYFNTQPQSGTIRQFLVFDEGHRVLSSDYMLRLVRECRAYGVGIILSSQYPSDFPSEISASMATKLVHGNGRDVDKVRAIVQLLGCEGREGDASNLDRFQAFVDNRHHPHTLLRTMNYPLYLLWSRLKKLGTATWEDLSGIEGIDTSKLPLRDLVRQLERLGIAVEKEGRVLLTDDRQ